MKLFLGHSLKLDTRFRCWVCLQPIELRPMSKLPIDPVWAFRELMAGQRPGQCISCGADYPFKRRTKVFWRYVQFLAMHLPDQESFDELERKFGSTDS